MKPQDMKRMVIADGDRMGIRKKTDQLIKENRISVDEQIELGNCIESMTKTKGWTFIEAYIFRNANISEILLEDDATKRLEARGLIKLIHYVNNMIALKNELMEKKVEN